VSSGWPELSPELPRRAAEGRPRRIAVVGSRALRPEREIRELLAGLPADTVIITGGAVGVDTVAEQLARERGLAVEVCRPAWHVYGRAAGMIRNGQIVQMADEVVAFWDQHSPGTRSTIRLVRHSGKPLRIIAVGL
jgi:hypothetical protein